MRQGIKFKYFIREAILKNICKGIGSETGLGRQPIANESSMPLRTTVAES